MSDFKNKIKFFIQNITVGSDCEFFDLNTELSKEINENILNKKKDVEVQHVYLNNKNMDVQYSVLPSSYTHILYFCNRCLFQFNTKKIYTQHYRQCRAKVPGLESYSEDNFKIYEVDGEKNKEYCKILCTLGRCFLDSKTVDDYVNPFFFYIITVNGNLAGFFSREKEIINCNLLSIVIFPDHQKMGLGCLLVDYSYKLAILEDKIGSPERPLSEAGERLFDTYWKTIIEMEIEKHEKITLNILSKTTGIAIDDIRYIIEKFNMIEKVNNTYKFIKNEDIKKLRLLKGGTIYCAKIY